MRLTLSSPEFVTHTSCLPSEIPFGWSPTGIVPITTGSGLLSTRRTRSSPVEAIHATCLAATTPSGALPTSSGSPSVLFVSTSMRTNVPSDASVTQTCPSSETEMPSGPFADLDRGGDLGHRRGGGRGRGRRGRAVLACRRGGRGGLARLLRVVALEDAEGGEGGRDQAEHEHRGQDDPEQAGTLRRPAGHGDLARGRRPRSARAPHCGRRGQRLLGLARELARGLLARGGVLGERALDHRFKRGREVRPRLQQRGRRLVDMGEHRPDVRVAQERRDARERVEEDAAERVDVRARVGVAALDRLRRGVVERAHEVPRGGHAGRLAAQRLDEPEVGQVRVLASSPASSEHVAGLDVAVDEPACGGRRRAPRRPG